MTDTTGTVGRAPLVRVAGDPADGDRARVYETARDVAGAVPVVRTGPTGFAGGPWLLATDGERTAMYRSPTDDVVRDAVGALDDGEPATEAADAVVTHDQDTGTLPTPDDGPLGTGTRRVLGPCGWVDPVEPGDTEFVSTDHDAGEVVDTGVRGRGRGDASADEPVGDAWETVRETDGDPVVVVNANETDGRRRADRTLLAGATVAVLDGVAAIAEYLGATDAVVYLSEADTTLANQVRTAIEAAADDLPVVPQVATGPDAYRAGEPTAALEALEGNDRVEPRLQPPTPASYGLYGRPTAIHSVRTVMQIRQAVGAPDSFDPAASDPGTRLFTVTGDVAAHATVELRSTGSLADAADAVSLDGGFKMACVGGVLGGLTGDLDVAPTAQSLRAAGLGTDGGLELLTEGRCALATAGERARFAAEENSGRCVPGREGTTQLAELLRDIYGGTFETDKLRELARTMERTANCRLGANAPRPVTTGMDEFEPEFRAHTDGRCPSDTCTEKL